MRSRRPVERRRPIFIGVEGKSEQALVRFLQHCCDKSGLHIHLACFTGTGGDTVTVVQESHRSLRKRSGSRGMRGRIVLLDADRVEADMRSGRDARVEASRLGLKVIFQEPNLEGLLVRLHPGCERRVVRPGNATAQLMRVSPRYQKPPTHIQLRERFCVADLRRAAQHDQDLQTLLRILGL